MHDTDGRRATASWTGPASGKVQNLNARVHRSILRPTKPRYPGAWRLPTPPRGEDARLCSAWRTGPPPTPVVPSGASREPAPCRDTTCRGVPRQRVRATGVRTCGRRRRRRRRVTPAPARGLGASFLDEQTAPRSGCPTSPARHRLRRPGGKPIATPITGLAWSRRLREPLAQSRRPFLGYKACG